MLRTTHALLQEFAEDTNPAGAVELGKILFRRKTVTRNNERFEYTATREETAAALFSLLQRRNDFLDSRRIARYDAAGNPTVLTDPQRTELLEEWKEAYHARRLQNKLQKRDSLKPLPQKEGKGKGHGKGKEAQGKEAGGAAQPAGAAGFGPNTHAMRHGKHSRWCRHLQKEYGVMNLALLIVFTGWIDLEKLDRAQERQSGASQLGDARLKRAAQSAECYLRYGKFLDNKIARGYKEEDLDGHEQQLLRDYRSGALREALNKAVLEFDHGKVVDPQGRLWRTTNDREQHSWRSSTACCCSLYVAVLVNTVICRDAFQLAAARCVMRHERGCVP